MKFIKVMAGLTLASMAFQAFAQTDGILRRSAPSEGEVTQSEQVEENKVLNININNTTQAAATPVATQGPAPRALPPPPMSRAEQIRQARLNAEAQTELKIVEKLEISRIKEERDRAERLFGNRMFEPAPQPVYAPVTAPPQSAVTVPVPPPVREARIEERAPSAVQVTNIRFVQP